jgi:hypothetical protein
MPDAIHIRDPFERASPKKEVTRIQWRSNGMQILLPDLGSQFDVKGLNEGNNFTAKSDSNHIQIHPGTYLLSKDGKSYTSKNSLGAIGLNEFVAPKSSSAEILLQHEPYTEVSTGKRVIIYAKIVGIDTARVSVQVSRLGGSGGGPGGGQRMVAMTRKTNTDYFAEIPAELVTPGVLNYRIIIQRGNEFTVFPGNIKSNPFAWDNYINETWKTFVATDNGGLELFNPTNDRARIYPSFRRSFQSTYSTGTRPGHLILHLVATELSGDHLMGFQYFIGEKLKGRTTELPAFDKLLIRARTANAPSIKLKVTLINSDAVSYSTSVTISNNFQDIEVPLKNLSIDSSLLMPRPYPGFLPLWFKASSVNNKFKLSDVEKIEVMAGFDVAVSELNKPYSLEVESIWLEKTK